MVLNTTDFCNFLKSLQTPWNASYTFGNGFLSDYRIVCVNVGCIPKCPKFAEFAQKAYSPFFSNLADFGKCQEPLQTPWNASYMIANGFLGFFGTVFMDEFAMLKLADFWPKSLGYSALFLTFRSKTADNGGDAPF